VSFPKVKSFLIQFHKYLLESLVEEAFVGQTDSNLLDQIRRRLQSTLINLLDVIDFQDLLKQLPIVIPIESHVAQVQLFSVIDQNQGLIVKLS